MAKREKLYGTTFYGNEASDYAKENGFLDYATFAKAFDAVITNDIISKTFEIGFWDQVNGFIDNSEDIEELREEIEELDSETDSEEIEKLENKIEELEEEQNYPSEIFQYYIVSDNGARIIQECTNDPLFYNEELDMYIWGVTQGTMWDYVLTDIQLNCGEDAFN